MKMLVLQHVPQESPGHIAAYAADKGIQLDTVELWKPYTIPDPQGYALVIVLGGPMDVYQEYPAKHDVLDLIRAHHESVPLLGICLGSQLFAYALGAEVKPNPGGKEIGYYDIELTEAGRSSSIFDGLPSPIRAFEWHGDVSDLPTEAELLATSKRCTYQAFSHRKMHGFLFHFEFTPEMVRGQIEIDRQWAHKDFELDEHALIAETERLAPDMKKQCYLLLDNLLNPRQ